MALQINKETVSGLRLLLKHRSIVAALSVAIVLATIFAGLYFLRDSKMLDAFRRDDGQLSAIQKAVEQNVTQTEQLQKDVAVLQKDTETIQEIVVSLQKSMVTSIVFNPNVPANIRADAFAIAKALKMNHGIRQQYREFVKQYPDAMWEHDAAATKNIQKVIPQSKITTNKNGISYEEYEME